MQDINMQGQRVVITNVRMPNMDGISLAKTYVSNFPKLKSSLSAVTKILLIFVTL